ncbi:hypothetical protein AYL99_03394 [Fonsecaea erecta]|uniref:Uncharacterized protein n=1 Tax=Fonsecaea erecta TaxID=1367422 RepID=A0A178ZPR9_9EURO|nr:hypothetical protein AYL99_03394 [Fonsecaea erecta]OAP61193.1 hypothetical protein AYL99_03394 [Fonsecaea erecta]
MELASRQGDFNKKFVVGWDTCIKKNGSGPFKSLEKGYRPSLPRFDARILHLPVLWDTYHARLTGEGMTFWVYMVRKATKRRVSDTQGSSYDEKNVGNALGPWSNDEIERELQDWNDDVVSQAMWGETWVDYNSFKVL